MSDFYLKSGAGAVERANSAVIAAGAKMVIARADTSTNYAVVRKWVWECTTAGTTAAAVPAWPAAITQDTTTVTDGTVTWTARKPGYSTGTTASWLFAAIFSDYISTAIAAGDRVFVSNNHAESIAGTINIALPGTLTAPNIFICVNDAAAPPTALATTATITASAADCWIYCTGAAYVYGITFVGAPTATGRMYMGATNGSMTVFESCYFNCRTTDNSGGGRIVPGNDGGGSQDLHISTYWKNCTINFGHSSGTMYVGGGNFLWEGGGVQAASATPAALFSRETGGVEVNMRGVDFSNFSSAFTIGGSYGGTHRLVNCKLPTAWSAVLGTPSGPGGRSRMYNTDNSGTNYRSQQELYAGTIKTETTIVHTGGASDGTTPMSMKLTTNANASYPAIPLETDEFVVWNNTAGTAKTVTVEFIHDSLTALTNGEIYLECQYLSATGTPLGAFISNAKADYLAAAAAQAASTATWTTTGLTNPNKQKLSVTFTPQLNGYIHCRVKLVKPSYTVYLDPLATVA